MAQPNRTPDNDPERLARFTRRLRGQWTRQEQVGAALDTVPIHGLPNRFAFPVTRPGAGRSVARAIQRKAARAARRKGGA